MGANPTQGIAVLLLLLAFTCLGMAMYSGGSIVFFLLTLVFAGISVSMFLKCKPWEHLEK